MRCYATGIKNAASGTQPWPRWRTTHCSVTSSLLSASSRWVYFITAHQKKKKKLNRAMVKKKTLTQFPRGICDVTLKVSRVASGRRWLPLPVVRRCAASGTIVCPAVTNPDEATPIFDAGGISLWSAVEGQVCSAGSAQTTGRDMWRLSQNVNSIFYFSCSNTSEEAAPGVLGFPQGVKRPLPFNCTKCKYSVLPSLGMLCGCMIVCVCVCVCVCVLM